MKTKLLLFLIITLTFFGLISCSPEGDEGDTIYDISTNSFEVIDYDYHVFTSTNLKNGSISKSYTFDFESQCKYSLNECTAYVEFYSLQDRLIHDCEVEKNISTKANESFKFSMDVSENVYNSAYSIKISLKGKSHENPSESSKSSPIVIEYLSISFYDGTDMLAKSRIKPNISIKESQIDNPIKEGYAFVGWYLDKQLTEPVKFPLDVKSSTNLYASWIQTSYSTSCQSAKIKNWTGYNSAVTYNIMPTGFDYDKLEKLGYHIILKVTYDVYYKKDYDVPLDVGYAGAPKYDAYISKSNGLAYGDYDLSTSTSEKTRTLETTLTPAQFKNENFYLKFSTDNIQNLVCFKNIKIEYTCVK